MVIRGCTGLPSAALLCVALAGAGHGQGLETTFGPAEIPPDSFSADQYVDSRGCVFIRAGVNGNTTWVPRVNREREVLCGFEPSLAGADQPPAGPVPATDAPDTAEDEATIVAEPAPATATPPEVVPTDPVPEVAAAPEPDTTPVASSPRNATMEPRPVATQPRTVATQIRPGAEARCGAADRGGAIVHGGIVRCDRHAVTPGAGDLAQQATYRGLPVNPVVIAPPPGYEAAWDDGRLNPYRGPRTAEGDAQMALAFDAPRQPVVDIRLSQRPVGVLTTNGHVALVHVTPQMIYGSD